MARIVNFGGTQPPVPLGGDLIRSIQLSELLRQGRNRPPIQSVGQGFAQLGQDAIQAFTLAKLRQQGEAARDNDNRIIGNLLQGNLGLNAEQSVEPTSRLSERLFPNPTQGAVPSVPVDVDSLPMKQNEPFDDDERFRSDFHAMSDARMAGPQANQPRTTAIPRPPISPIDQSLIAPVGATPQAPTGFKPKALSEALRNPGTAQIAQNLLLQQRSNRLATAAQERQFKALSDRLALGQQFTAGENQKNRSSSEKIAANRLAGGSTTAQKNFTLAQNDPAFKQFLADTGADNTPKSVKEFNFFNSLEDEDSKAEFLNLKRATQTIDLGGQVIQPNPLNPLGEPGAVRPKTVPPQSRPSFKANVARETELGKIEGKTLGQAKADLPKVEASADQVIGLIDSLVSHPGLNGVVGVPSFSGALHIPGTAEADFRERLNQIQGKQFLEAFQSIKGGGQITEVEGKKATQAIARMGTAQTEKSFIEAAKEFQGIVKKGIGRARTKAGITPKGGATGGPSGAIGGGEFNFNPETGQLERVERRKQ